MTSGIERAVRSMPHSWPRAPDITKDCGPYQLQAMLAAAGHEVDIASLRPPWGHFGYLLPWKVPVLLARHGGISAKTRYRLEPSDLRWYLLGALTRGHPTMLIIRATRGRHGLHWISVWGYDPEEGFQVYDSQYESREGGVGNTVFTPEFISSRLHTHVRTLVEIDLP